MRVLLAAILISVSTAAFAQSASDAPQPPPEPARKKLNSDVPVVGGITLGVGTIDIGEDNPSDLATPEPLRPNEEPRPTGGLILKIPIN